MIFNNRENKCYHTEDGEIWKSRSAAVVGMILMKHQGEIYTILGKRGPAVPNAVGQWCMPCGFLDYDETLEDAVVREIWEESGFNVYKALNEYEILHDQMDFPWRIHSQPEDEQQNVSHHYALYLSTEPTLYRETEELPPLTFENNPKIGEVDEVKWVNIKELIDYDCAFEHDSIIRVFVNNLLPKDGKD